MTSNQRRLVNIVQIEISCVDSCLSNIRSNQSQEANEVIRILCIYFEMKSNSILSHRKEIVASLDER